MYMSTRSLIESVAQEWYVLCAYFATFVLLEIRKYGEKVAMHRVVRHALWAASVVICLHAAVAPACNIQCNYCNRKYDCANESRPGVVSEKLTPEQAAKKVLAVASTIPQNILSYCFNFTIWNTTTQAPAPSDLAILNAEDAVMVLFFQAIRVNCGEAAGNVTRSEALFPTNLYGASFSGVYAYLPDQGFDGGEEYATGKAGGGQVDRFNRSEDCQDTCAGIRYA